VQGSVFNCPVKEKVSDRLLGSQRVNVVLHRRQQIGPKPIRDPRDAKRDYSTAPLEERMLRACWSFAVLSKAIAGQRRHTSASVSPP
jgi:hypothetical protein